MSVVQQNRRLLAVVMGILSLTSFVIPNRTGPQAVIQMPQAAAATSKLLQVLS